MGLTSYSKEYSKLTFWQAFKLSHMSVVVEEDTLSTKIGRSHEVVVGEVERNICEYLVTRPKKGLNKSLRTVCGRERTGCFLLSSPSSSLTNILGSHDTSVFCDVKVETSVAYFLLLSPILELFTEDSLFSANRKQEKLN